MCIRDSGSEANDPFTMRDGKIATATNKNGGINGGITNGMLLLIDAGRGLEHRAEHDGHTVGDAAVDAAVRCV